MTSSRATPTNPDYQSVQSGSLVQRPIGAHHSSVTTGIGVCEWQWTLGGRL